jgi:hypothetical protein
VLGKDSEVAEEVAAISFLYVADNFLNPTLIQVLGSRPEVRHLFSSSCRLRY